MSRTLRTMNIRVFLLLQSQTFNPLAQNKSPRAPICSNAPTKSSNLARRFTTRCPERIPGKGFLNKCLVCERMQERFLERVPGKGSWTGFPQRNELSLIKKKPMQMDTDKTSIVIHVFEIANSIYRIKLIFINL